MANKKIWAYAKEANGEYVVGEKHPFRMFYIWDALRLKNKDIHEFNKLTFMSTDSNPINRVTLSPVKTGFYRYPKGYNSSEIHSGDSLSLSHSIAIQVLSEMDEINFKISDLVEFKLKVNSIRSDDLKIQLTNKNKFSYYYPHLICNFTEPDDLVMKWGGKLAIEVKHTHACEQEKITDFENHGIPIIEVNIATISIEKKFNTKNPTAEILERYYNYLKLIFSRHVFGKILSDPVSVSYFKGIVIEKNAKIKNLQNEILKSKDYLQILQKKKIAIESQLSLSIKEIEKRTKHENTLLRENNTYQVQLVEHENRISEIEKRGFGFYISQLFGLKP